MNLARVKALNFLVTLVTAAKSRYWQIFLVSKGLEPEQIGLLMSLGWISQMFGLPGWGLIADRTSRPAAALAMGMSAWVLTLQLFRRPDIYSSFSVCAAAYALLMLCESATNLVTVVTVNAVSGGRGSFGGQRWLSSLGFGVGTLVCGALVQRGGNWVIFAWSTLFAIFIIALALSLDTGTTTRKAEKTHVAKPPGRTAALLASKPLRLLLINSVLYGVLLNLVDQTLILYVQRDLGKTKTFVGWMTLFGTLSEIPVFLYSEQMIQWLGHGRVILLAHAAFALRLILLCFADAEHTILLCGSQLLHGLCFGGYWAASVSRVSQIAPTEIKGSALSALSTTTYMVGGAIASSLWGYVYGVYGATPAFRAGVFMAVASAMQVVSGMAGVN